MTDLEWPAVQLVHKLIDTKTVAINVKIERLPLFDLTVRYGKSWDLARFTKHSKIIYLL